MTTLAKPEFSPARRDALHDYVIDIRRRLYLQHWQIDLPDQWPAAHDALAEIDPCETRYIATLRLGPGFWDQSAEDIRKTITHEVLHLHHARLTNVIRLGEYKRELGQTLYEHLYDQIRIEAEYMVDALSVVVAEHMPMPPDWPE